MLSQLDNEHPELQLRQAWHLTRFRILPFRGCSSSEAATGHVTCAHMLANMWAQTTLLDVELAQCTCSLFAILARWVAE